MCRAYVWLIVMPLQAVSAKLLAERAKARLQHSRTGQRTPTEVSKEIISAPWSNFASLVFFSWVEWTHRSQQCKLVMSSSIASLGFWSNESRTCLDFKQNDLSWFAYMAHLQALTLSKLLRFTRHLGHQYTLHGEPIVSIKIYFF